MGLRDDIFKARIVSRERPYYGGPPEEAVWMVCLRGSLVSLRYSQPLEIEEKREWVWDHTPLAAHPLHPSDSKILEKIRVHKVEERRLRNERI